mmetsp:Transcript_29634/g.90680  ORF Transcript_29634/g.90680 Transcript_29634/m.90680 type:complete len:92 (+) Transcript_29634:59-334(+)
MLWGRNWNDACMLHLSELKSAAELQDRLATNCPAKDRLLGNKLPGGVELGVGTAETIAATLWNQLLRTMAAVAKLFVSPPVPLRCTRPLQF